MVASAVLVSAGHVLQWNAEIVKRWSNEIQEAVQSKNGMVQVTASLCVSLHLISAGSLAAQASLRRDVTCIARQSAIALRCHLRTIHCALAT